jgi:hypothetical protein
MTARRLTFYSCSFLAGYSVAWLATMIYLGAPLGLWAVRMWWPW